jgi:hypothetical protein
VGTHKDRAPNGAGQTEEREDPLAALQQSNLISGVGNQAQVHNMIKRRSDVKPSAAMVDRGDLMEMVRK